MSKPEFIVLDTNVVLDLLHFRDPGVAPLATALTAGLLCCLTDTDCLAELSRVVGYPELGLTPAAADALLACYKQLAMVVPGQGSPIPLPICQDPEDQRFLELAARGQATWLVSKDKLVLQVRRSRPPLPFAILNPTEATTALRNMTITTPQSA